MSKATKIAVAAALALAVTTGACSASETAGAETNSRYTSELVEHDTSTMLSAYVITDTETGDRWLVAASYHGSVCIEQMGSGAE